MTALAASPPRPAWIGSLLVHGVALAVVVLASRRWVELPPPEQQLAIEATVVQQRASRLATAAPPPKRETVPDPPLPAAKPAIAPPPVPKPAPAQLVSRQPAVPDKPTAAAPVAKPPAAKPSAAAVPKVAAEAPASVPSAAAVAEARERQRREAELRARMAAEERTDSLRASGVMTGWTQSIRAKVERAWLKPPSVTAALDCIVRVTQVPGGEVVAVVIQQCNGDSSARESIEAAVYRASPLPAPPDAALFERVIEFRFRPSE